MTSRGTSVEDQLRKDVTAAAFAWTGDWAHVQRILSGAGIPTGEIPPLLHWGRHVLGNFKAGDAHEFSSCKELIERLKAAIARPTLRQLTWLVTRHCHLDCAYCYVPTIPASRAADSLLTFGEACDIVAQCYALGAERLELRGGEPFLRKDLPHVIQLASDLGMTVDVVTKVALSDSMIGALSQARNLRLGISLDTVDPAVGDRLLRKCGQTDRLMRTVGRAVSAGLSITIEATVTKDTLPQLSRLIEFAAAAGVAALHLREIAPHGVRPVSALLLGEEARRELQKLADADAPLSVRITPAFAASPGCGEGIMSVAMLPDGRATKCTASLAYDPRMIYADLRSVSVRDALKGDALQKLLNQVWASARSLPPEYRPQAGVPPCSQLVDNLLGSVFPQEAEPV